MYNKTHNLWWRNETFFFFLVVLSTSSNSIITLPSLSCWYFKLLDLRSFCRLIIQLHVRVLPFPSNPRREKNPIFGGRLLYSQVSLFSFTLWPYKVVVHMQCAKRRLSWKAHSKNIVDVREVGNEELIAKAKSSPSVVDCSRKAATW